MINGEMMDVKFHETENEIDDAEVLSPSGEKDGEVLYSATKPSSPRYWVFLSREARLHFLTFEKDSLEQRAVVKKWIVDKATSHGVRKHHIHHWIDKCLLWAFTPNKREVETAIESRSDFVMRRVKDYKYGYLETTFMRVMLSQVFPGYVSEYPPVRHRVIEPENGRTY